MENIFDFTFFTFRYYIFFVLLITFYFLPPYPGFSFSFCAVLLKNSVTLLLY